MADADQTLTLTVLKEIRAELKEARSDTRRLLELVVQSIESNRRHFEAFDQRFNSLDRRIEATQQQIKISAGDLELMLKGELMGRLTHFETKIDHRIAELEELWTPRS